MAGLPIRTTDLWSRLAAYIDRRLMRRPELRQAVVTATGAGSITIQYPNEATDIPGVRCIGFGAVSLPSVSDDVWVLTFSDGSTPICIGEV
jgi:hypothetical protein